MRFIVGNQSNKDERDELLTRFLVNAQDGDVIELLPGTYFSKDNPFICNIERNITIVGQSENQNDVTLYCSFTVGADTLMIFRNLIVNYPADEDNTLSAFDGAEIYCDNVKIDRNTSDYWDTIYGQNSFFSFKDSSIMTGSKTKAIGISLENSQMFADNTYFQLLFQKNSLVYLKDSLVTHKLELRRHSRLFFKNIKVESSMTDNKDDLAVKSGSQMNGQDLVFASENPQVRILKSHFDVSNFQPGSKNINFKFDDSSKVIADGKLPSRK